MKAQFFVSLLLLTVIFPVRPAISSPSVSCPPSPSISRPDHFEGRLASACLAAESAVRHPQSATQAWLGHLFLMDFARYSDALSALGREPSEFGAYLIAGKIGLPEALKRFEHAMTANSI